MRTALSYTILNTVYNTTCTCFYVPAQIISQFLMDHANVELQTTMLSKLLAAFPTLVILYLLVRDAHVLLHVLRVFKRLVTLVAAVPG